MTRCSTGRSTQKYKGGGTDLSDILESAGDIIYADAALSAENLVIGGTPGHVLKVSASGIPEWGASTGTSQWVTSGDDISYITGNVGIGTTAPDANLHVVGNTFVSTDLGLGGTLTMGTVLVEALHELSAITATGNVTPHVIQFTNPTTGFVTTGNVSMGKDLTVAGNVAVDTNTLFVDTVNNRVGNGTVTPGYTLDVVGDVNFTGEIRKGGVIQSFGGGGGGFSGGSAVITATSGYGNLEVGGPSGAYIDLKGPATDDFDIRMITTGAGGQIQVAGGTTAMYFASSGRVGIGTTTPTSALDVVGTVKATAFDGVNKVIYATAEKAVSTWTDRTIADGNWQSVTWSPELSLFVAVASTGTNRAATSPDGITWTNRTIDFRGWKSVTWSPELSLFVAVAYSGTSRVATSPDGVTWTGRTIALNFWRSVTWSPELSLFVVVAYYKAATSPDGVTWTSRTINTGSQWQSVTWSPELTLFVAVANGGTTRAATSSDGITWTDRVINTASKWESVAWSPELSLFVAVAGTGTNRVATSNFGIPTSLNTPMAHPVQLSVDTVNSRVGIGTTTPTVALDVAGDINFTGEIRKGGVIQTFGGGSSLYTFNSHIFTPCSGDSRYGPEIADALSAYGNFNPWNDTNLFNITTRGFQLWKVPKTGTYRITARGAKGGEESTSGGSNNNTPGSGGAVVADFALTITTQIVFIVGQTPPQSTGNYNSGSGGGATWVLKPGAYTDNNDVYMVAGGGGAAGPPHYNSGTAGHADASSQGTLGGGGTSHWNNNGGGAGWTADGAPSGARGGVKPSGGAMGGTGTTHGGFGGGGSEAGDSAAGGAGASGGRAALRYDSTGTDTARGGTSYITTNATNRQFLGIHGLTNGGNVSVQYIP